MKALMVITTIQDLILLVCLIIMAIIICVLVFIYFTMPEVPSLSDLEIEVV